MFNFKKYFVGLLGVSLFVCALATLLPLTGRGQGQGQPPHALRNFYLTQTTHDGSQALSACANGYHMASLWEIWDPSNLKYNTDLGSTTDDSGFGPPRSLGWIRTGEASSFSSTVGVANCQAWTSADFSHSGTLLILNNDWISTQVNPVSPWQGFRNSCSVDFRVWCVQD